MRNADPTMRWPLADGPAAALIRNLRADASPLGASERWPLALRRTIELILPSTVQMAVFWGPECIAFYNDAYATTLGNKHPGAMGRPAGDLSPEVWPRLQATFDSVRQSGKSIGGRDWPFVINRGGQEETLFFDFCWSPVRGDGGEFDGVLCIVAETTERVRELRALAASERRAREELERLRECEARLRALVGLIPAPALAVAADGRVQWASESLCAYVGLDQSDLLGQVWTLGAHPEDGPRLTAEWAQSLALGQPLDTVVRLRRRDGIWRRHQALVRPVDASWPGGGAVPWVAVLTELDVQVPSLAQLLAV